MSSHDPEKTPANAIVTAQQMTAAMQVLAKQIEGLRGYGRHNRRMIWGLVVSLVIDIALTFVVAWAVTQSQEANNQAEQNRQNQINVCQSTNGARQQNKELWMYLLSISPTAQLTPEQQRQRTLIKAKIDSVFAPRDCSRL